MRAGLWQDGSDKIGHLAKYRSTERLEQSLTRKSPAKPLNSTRRLDLGIFQRTVLEKVQQKGIFGKSVHEEGEPAAGGSLMRLVVVLQDRQPGQRTVEKNCPALDNSSRST